MGVTHDRKALHDEALMHLRRRQLRPAQAILRGLQAQHAGSVHCLLLEGHCALMGAGDRQAAEHLYERAIASEATEADAACDALHSLARLRRIEERWDEAEAHYAAALVLRPRCESLSQEGRFSRAKRLLEAGQPAEAADVLDESIAGASAEWRPHFARERASARALAGGSVETVVGDFKEALRLGGLPHALALGEALSTLAAHAEAEGPASRRAAQLLQHARAAFASCAAGPAGGADPARACFRLGQTLEGLCALGEPLELRDPGAEAAAAAEEAPDASARLPGSAAAQREAAEAYGRAIALRPTMSAAYEALGRLRLGVSRLSNFGATHAAGLHVDEAERLLRTAHALQSAEAGGAGAATGAAAAGDGAAELLDTIETSRREVAAWSEVAASLRGLEADGAEGGGAPAAASAAAAEPAAAAAAAAAWQLAPVFAGARELPRVDAGDAAALWRLVRAGEPVVIRGLQRRAGFAGRAAWSRDALARSPLGGQVVKVSVSLSGRFDGPEAGPLWGLGEADEVLVRPPETRMRLCDLLTLLRAPTAEAFYCEYSAMHQYLGDELQRMAPLPPHVRALRPLLANLWLGKGATTSPLHYDDYENLLSQVRGTKRLLLFPPSDLPNLYYTPRVKGMLRYSWPNNFSRVAPSQEEARRRVVFGSSINVSQPDLRRHPLVSRASPFTCRLREGETLLLPAFWHHEVHSEAAPPGDINVAVNHWFRNVSAPPLGF